MVHMRTPMLVLALVAGMTTAIAETITVTNTNNTGAGSLRQAILDANVDPSPTTILFNIPGSGAKTIVVPDGALPPITAPLSIIGDNAGTGQLIIENGAINIPGIDIGFQFQGGASGSEIRDITITGFVFGVNILGTANTTIQFNRFINNYGIDIRDENTQGTFIRANFHTASVNGVRGVLSTGSRGLLMLGESITNENVVLLNTVGAQIGGVAPGAPNTITGSKSNGLELVGNTNSLIINNTISRHLGNGIVLSNGGFGNTLEGNVLFGNTGFDIVASGQGITIRNNRSTGNLSMNNGISGNQLINSSITNNIIDAGSLELNNSSAVTISGNTITNDPNGFSGHGAITVSNSSHIFINNNSVTNNGGNGILLNATSSSTISENQITENFRAGVRLEGGGVFNKISRNVIADNHNDVIGGRTGILLLNANFNKPAPVISSVTRVGNQIVISGTTSTAGDVIEVFLSDAESATFPLKQNARRFLVTTTAVGTNWTANVSTAGLSGDVFFITTATDTQNNTSQFSNVRGTSVNAARAISDIDADNSGMAIRVSPNPFTESFHITSEDVEEQTASVQIYNLQGALVYSVDQYKAKQEISLSHLSAGMYTVQIIENNGKIWSTNVFKRD
jgi:parallel beta-helix repeat protein